MERGLFLVLPLLLTLTCPASAAAQEPLQWVGATRLEALDPVAFAAVQGEDGVARTAQALGDGWYAFLLPAALDPEARWVGVPATGDAAPAPRVVARAEDDRLLLDVAGRRFTEYRFRDGSRPYFFPVLDRDGVGLSRHWPMEEQAGEARDHPHHRSLWFSFGDVNGHDLWSESGRHGRIHHQEFLDVVSGPVFGGFTSRNEWQAPDGAVLCTDRRTFRVYATEGVILFDVEITLIAGDEAVTFGDTKEGMMGWRVPATMRLKGEVAAGHIVNRSGDRDGATWGKRAAWCDYHGPVAGRVRGIAIFDHPSNLRHPTWWHVRDYGLFAANPFGMHYFEGKPKGTGDHRLPAGERLTFRYRFLVHEGNEVEGGVEAQYRAWERFTLQ